MLAQSSGFFTAIVYIVGLSIVNMGCASKQKPIEKPPYPARHSGPLKSLLKKPNAPKKISKKRAAR